MTIEFAAGFDGTVDVNDTVCVFFGAASCRASVQFAGELAQLRGRCAQVIAPDYSLVGDYDHTMTCHRTFDSFDQSLPSGWRGKLLVVGASMGAINALKFTLAALHAYDARLIFEDPVLSSAAMKRFDRFMAARLSRRSDSFKRKLPHGMLNHVLPDHGQDIWEEEVLREVERYTLKAHLEGKSVPEPQVLRVARDLQALTMRGFLSFVPAILDADVPEGLLAGVRVAVIDSGIDPVRHLGRANADVDRVCGGAKLLRIGINGGGHHVATAERPDGWRAALADATDHVLK